MTSLILKYREWSFNRQIEAKKRKLDGKKSSLVDNLFWIVGIALCAIGYFVFTIAITSGSSMLPTLSGNEVLGVDLTVKQGDVRYGDLLGFDCSRAKTPYDNCVKRVIGKPGDVISVKNTVVFINGKPLKRIPLSGKAVRAVFEHEVIAEFHNVLSKVVTLSLYQETLPNGKTYTVQVASNPEGYLPLLNRSKDKRPKVYADLKSNYDAVVKSLNMDEVVLGENEYFLMGDNRGFSADSMDIGAVYWSEVQGRAVDLGVKLPW